MAGSHQKLGNIHEHPILLPRPRAEVDRPKISGAIRDRSKTRPATGLGGPDAWATCFLLSKSRIRVSQKLPVGTGWHPC